ncbi:unnamed protein product [Didymodactylos carnosus]|uniref:Uncharacterized protein n=1 Tax=Didymodactylos carnosus TaxID=1234261 RepID=A0A8S2ERN2_9BILA|nr:unnamed protein product [Didymodactylos carnosus]CAF4029341.1 unnamed protein product [Didymodactylos carnosus]
MKAYRIEHCFSFRRHPVKSAEEECDENEKQFKLTQTDTTDHVTDDQPTNYLASSAQANMILAVSTRAQAAQQKFSDGSTTTPNVNVAPQLVQDRHELDTLWGTARHNFCAHLLESLAEDHQVRYSK